MTKVGYLSDVELIKDMPYLTFTGMLWGANIWKKIDYFLVRPAVNITVKKSISSELDIAIHVIASQLSGHCDAISNRMWRHRQNDNWVSEARGWYVKIVVLSSFMDSLCHVRNKEMYVLLWQTVSVPTWVLFWHLFPSVLRNSGNKHQNDPLMGTETVCHSSTYVVLYITGLHCVSGLIVMFFDWCQMAP